MTRSRVGSPRRIPYPGLTVADSIAYAELAVGGAHLGPTLALAVDEHDGTPLIISANRDGALRSWRLDGSPGELHVDGAHLGPISVLSVLEHAGAPLIISAGHDGALRSWRVGLRGWAHLMRSMPVRAAIDTPASVG